MQSYIYLITDARNGMRYVGQHTLGVKKDYFTGSTIINNFVSKYGIKKARIVFKKHIIVQGDFNQHLLDELERHYIRLHATKKPFGYNLTDGGDKTVRGMKASEETKEKQRAAWKIRKTRNPPKPKLLKSGIDTTFKKGRVSVNKGKKLPQDHALAISKGNTGKIRTKEHIQKVLTTKLAKYGRIILSEEHKKKLSLKIKGQKIPRNRKIAQYSLDDQFIKIWDTLTEAKKVIGAKKASTVANNIAYDRRGLKTSAGFIWKWVDDKGNQLNPQPS